jgi:hypothetical protein
MEIEARLVHCENNPLLISVKFFGRTIDASALHFSKAFSSIFSTLLGIEIETN